MINIIKEGKPLKKGLNFYKNHDGISMFFVYGKPIKILNPITLLNNEIYLSDFSKGIKIRLKNLKTIWIQKYNLKN